MSQHLRALADARLVEVRPSATGGRYWWRREGLRDAAAFLEEIWTDRLARLEGAADREEWPELARAVRENGRSPSKETRR